LLLDEVQDVELPDLPIREEAIHRVLFIIKQFEHGRQLRQDQQLHVALTQI
jgi:hypothetical protein